jgi:hypothetical protein
MSRRAKSLAESGRGTFWRGRRRVTIGFAPAEYEAVRLAAGAAGVTIATMVRTALRDAAPTAAAEQLRRERALEQSLAALRAEVRRLRLDKARLTKLAQPEVRLLPGSVDPAVAALLQTAAGWGDAEAEVQMRLAEHTRDPRKRSEYLATSGHVLSVAEALRTVAARAAR